MVGVGGMVSFQHKLAGSLEQRGIQVGYDLEEGNYASALVIGGTRQLGRLVRARRRGVRLVQRLDGMNWLHRVKSASLNRWFSPRVSMRQFLRSEYGNWLLTLIRGRLAHHIVYQSHFSQAWWEKAHGLTRVGSTIIYNGVDLQFYHPEGEPGPPENIWRILLVEGSLMGGYELGLEAAVQLGKNLSQRLQALQKLSLNRPVQVRIAGRVSPQVQQSWQERLENSAVSRQNLIQLDWAGLVNREAIPSLDRSAHLLFSADLNAACPNSVIEALACGLPVVAFDTGSLHELVQEGAGRVVPYGGDPWLLDPPDFPGLAEAALEVLQNQSSYRPAARRRAEAIFGLDEMVERYLQVLLPG
jgi:glycosyltransferase involved in cell wall biosynthesis